MLDFATLILHHPHNYQGADGILHITARNFPVLPINSGVEIVIPDIIKEGECHDFLISSYSASTLRGNGVSIRWDTLDSFNRHNLDVWNKFLMHSIYIADNTWAFSKVLDFNIKR